MPKGKKAFKRLLLVASALTGPAIAQAATPRESELEARLLRLESEMQQLRADLAASRSAQEQTAAAAQSAATRSEEAVTRVASLESKPAPQPAAQPDGFKVGGTTFKMGGFVKVVGSATHYGGGDVAVGALGREFYLPQQIPVGGKGSTDVIGHARQTRISFSTATPVAGKEVKSVIEFDFALAAAPVGAQRSTNPYTPTFRRGFIS